MFTPQARSIVASKFELYMYGSYHTSNTDSDYEPRIVSANLRFGESRLTHQRFNLSPLF